MSQDLSNDNVVRVESLKDATIMVAAPGANRENTKVYIDRSGDGNKVILEVGTPELPDGLSEKVDFEFKKTLAFDSKYDLGLIKVGIRDGLIFIKVMVSSDKIVDVKISDEFDKE